MPNRANSNDRNGRSNAVIDRMRIRNRVPNNEGNNGLLEWNNIASSPIRARVCELHHNHSSSRNSPRKTSRARRDCGVLVSEAAFAGYWR